MTTLVVGNPSVFALESGITQPYERLSLRALGYFVVHVGGRVYGIRSPEATMLACSLDAVRRRIAKRGTHCLSFVSDSAADQIVAAFCAAMSGEGSRNNGILGMEPSEFLDALNFNEAVMAPDGDEAFDDGSYILHFDQGDSVRLIAFKNVGSGHDIASTIAEIVISAEMFYGILDEWQQAFQIAWENSLAAN